MAGGRGGARLRGSGRARRRSGAERGDGAGAGAGAWAGAVAVTGAAAAAEGPLEDAGRTPHVAAQPGVGLCYEGHRRDDLHALPQGDGEDGAHGGLDEGGSGPPVPDMPDQNSTEGEGAHTVQTMKGCDILEDGLRPKSGLLILLPLLTLCRRRGGSAGGVNFPNCLPNEALQLFPAFELGDSKWLLLHARMSRRAQ
ncbi:uncharacterized protein LOC106631109 isoform X2 [Falco cherrug]|uniref:uncharacterized protein LOC106631109 isoform X2 n=1 Tax=Falco cherrug TaxID=345164 RepID=UPI00247941BF|nr:uncharacterized protein LOC106631109 isoform X2 [Falco cherrug]